MEFKTLAEVGEYTQLMGRVFTLPMRWRMFFRSVIREMYSLGVGSLWIVFIISLFIGAVITIQLSINMTNPLIPRFTIGYSTREIMILEFSSTVMCLILSGKVGSSVASELGTMRVTEQIDAMEIMGVNSANFLILPKIVGFMAFIPVLSVFSMVTGIVGGYIACDLALSMTHKDFRLRAPAFLHALLRRLLDHQVGSLCLHHLLGSLLLRLLREGRGTAGRRL